MSLQEIQKTLLELNVNDYTEKKNNLTYLSWANAWSEVLKVYPNAKYDIKKDDNGIACFGNSDLGYMVYTTVTIEEETKEMWLPVLDYKNKAIKSPDMFNVNTSIMRCLTKNLAMFGLGLYIYAGEDITFAEKENSQDKINSLNNILSDINTVEELQKFYKDNAKEWDNDKKTFNKFISDRKKHLTSGIDIQ